MSVGLFRVDRDRALELPDGFRILAPLLVDEPQLIARLRIMWIDRGRFEHAVKVLTAAQSGAQVRELAAQIPIRVEQEERRGQPAGHGPDRSPNQQSAYERNPG